MQFKSAFFSNSTYNLRYNTHVQLLSLYVCVWTIDDCIFAVLPARFANSSVCRVLRSYTCTTVYIYILYTQNVLIEKKRLNCTRFFRETSWIWLSAGSGRIGGYNILVVAFVSFVVVDLACVEQPPRFTDPHERLLL